MSAPGLFLDRDGVVNRDDGFLHHNADIRFIDGIFVLVKEFIAHGFRIVIVTNQSGIGRGLFSEADFSALMDWMKREFAAQGARLDAVYHCPDHPTEGFGAYRRDTPRRKPGPGMFFEAAGDLGLDLARSWCVGDRSTDIEAGRAAGVGTLVLYDPTAAAIEHRGDTWIAPDLASVSALLRRAENGASNP